MIKVINSGILSSVQDLGRLGTRQLGIAKCGVLDPLALRLGNSVLGNNENAAAIEITHGGAQFRFSASCQFVLMGSSLNATLNNIPVHAGWPQSATNGDILIFKGAPTALRSYLCVEGGINVPTVFNSCSTDLQAEFGGFHGRALTRGDVLQFGCSSSSTKINKGIRHPSYLNEIRVIEGPHAGLFSKQQIDRFFSQHWMVSALCNRMGIRLQSDKQAEFSHTIRLPSQAVHPGIIQLPPDGNPIVLLNDCQTTGGYPIIGQIFESDLRHFAQMLPNQTICLKRSSIDVSLEATQRHDLYLQKVKWSLENQTQGSQPKVNNNNDYT
ncbi:Allophanate hydrolase 2 subunit 2 [Pseudoalteromonas luteoviolacea B = ATCC 29581]|nr:Allophanate hydrolase 2 subunit 2 [Pseudoalteromonas luteoviolacea B = ATCC 29581]